MTHTGTFKVGDAIGPYTIQDLIGVGFMGEVYRAARRETSDIVALKCLQVRHIDNPDLVQRARREALALTEIRCLAPRRSRNRGTAGVHRGFGYLGTIDNRGTFTAERNTPGAAGSAELAAATGDCSTERSTGGAATDHHVDAPASGEQ